MGLADDLGLHITDLKAVKFAAGQSVFRTGDQGADAYLVVKGDIEISGLNARGERVVLSRLARGQIFGEMSVLNNSRRNADAVATSETICAVIDGHALERRLNNLDPYMRFWIDFMSERLVELSKRAHA